MTPREAKLRELAAEWAGADDKYHNPTIQMSEAGRHLLAILGAEAEEPPLDGFWPANDLRRSFVEGAKWWEFESHGATMWQSDRNRAEEEAERRHPGGKAEEPRGLAALAIKKRLPHARVMDVMGEK